MCRGTSALHADAGFAEDLSSCEDPYASQGIASLSYQGYFEPSHARLTVQASLVGGDPIALEPGHEYSAFRVKLARSQSTGTGSCPGCSVPMKLVLAQIQLLQVAAAGNDPILTQPRNRKFVTWQSPPTAAIVPHEGFALSIGRVAWDRDGRGGVVSVELAQSEGAILEVFDVGGRRVSRQRIEGRASGTHDVRVSARHPFRSGHLFLRLTQGTSAVTKQIVVLR
jgi:hypothetical protein